MADSYEHFQQHMSGMFESFFRQDEKNLRHGGHGDEKPLDKTGEVTEETTSSYMHDNNSRSFASWRDCTGNVAAPSTFPDSPHLLAIDADDETSISEELCYNNGTSAEETYDGSKPFAEWLSCKDADNVVLTSLPPQQGRRLVFRSAHGQVEGANKDISLNCFNAGNELSDTIPASVPQHICGAEVARIFSESCGCTIITQLNDLLDTRHCNGDVQDSNNNDDFHRDEFFVEEAVEVPFDDELLGHHGYDSNGDEETILTEQGDMEEICLRDSFGASLDDEIHLNVDVKDFNTEDCSLKETDAHLVTPDRNERLNNDEGETFCTSEGEGDREEFPMDEIYSPTVTQNDHGHRKKLAQMLLDSSLFQLNGNPWTKCVQPSHDEWRSGCSIDGDDINTVDLESLDDALNNHDEIFRNAKPRAPQSLSHGVHLLGACSAASSVSSDHSSIFDRVLRDETSTKQIGSIDMTPLKSVEETCECFDDTTRRLDSLASRINNKKEPTWRDDNYSSSRRSSISSKETGLDSRATSNSRREDNHFSSRHSSISSRGTGKDGGRAQGNSRREDNHSRRSSSSRGNEEDPKGGKENTIIVMSIRGRRGKDRYARHARKQRLASKAANLQP